MNQGALRPCNTFHMFLLPYGSFLLQITRLDPGIQHLLAQSNIIISEEQRQSLACSQLETELQRRQLAKLAYIQQNNHQMRAPKTGFAQANFSSCHILWFLHCNPQYLNWPRFYLQNYTSSLLLSEVEIIFWHAIDSWACHQEKQ